MVSIIGVGVHRPPSVPLEERQNELGLSDVELRRFIRGFGFSQISFDPGATEVDMLLSAVEDIPGYQDIADRIRYIIRPRTVRSPSPYPQSPLHELRRRLGLHEAHAFALTDHACAGGLLALDLAAGLLADDVDSAALALILTGEKTYGTVGQVIPGVAVLGEATAAIVVQAAGQRNRMLGYAASTTPIPDSGLTMTPGALVAFGEIYSTALFDVIHRALASASLAPSDIDRYLPHNVSRIIGIRTGRSLGLSTDRIFVDNIGRTAHCFSADTFINLHSMMGRGDLEEGDVYLMTSVGLGATFSAAVFRH